MVLIMFEEDEARKKMMSERFEEEFLPLTLKKLEFMLRQNGGKWFVGDEVTPTAAATATTATATATATTTTK